MAGSTVDGPEVAGGLVMRVLVCGGRDFSTPLPGPLPCMDWPECCSTEGERMRKEALIELLRCWGWIPPAPEGN